MQLRLDVDDRDDHAVVIATGEIDVETAGSLSEAVTEALTRAPRVLLDLSAVTFIDSTGLGVLVRAHRAADARGGFFAVVHPTPQTRKLVRVLGLDQLLHVYDTHEQALAEA